MIDTPLSRDELRSYSRAVFAEAPHESVSDRYSFFPTDRLVDAMEPLGWLPAAAKETRVRKPERRGTQRHLVRFRRADDFGSTAEVPEIVALNSHDGTTMCKFYAGVFRYTCRNLHFIHGINMAEFQVRHINITMEMLDALLKDFTVAMAPVMDSINDYRGLLLEPEERIEMAYNAIHNVWEHPPAVESQALLVPRRPEDASHDLWTTFSVIQEHLVKGGIEYRKEVRPKEGRAYMKTIKTRPIGAIKRDIETNLALWALLVNSYRRYKK